MQPIEQLRNVLVSPTLKGLLVIPGIIWTAAVDQATVGFAVSFLAVVVVYLLDGTLGTTAAIKREEFRKADLKRWIYKFVAYSGLALLAFTTGCVIGLGVVRVFPEVEGLAAAYLLTTGVNIALFATDGLSVLGHIDELTNGALSSLRFMKWLRPILEQMRDWDPAEALPRKVHAAPNGGA